MWTKIILCHNTLLHEFIFVSHIYIDNNKNKDLLFKSFVRLLILYYLCKRPVYPKCYHFGQNPSKITY